MLTLKSRFSTAILIEMVSSYLCTDSCDDGSVGYHKHLHWIREKAIPSSGCDAMLAKTRDQRRERSLFFSESLEK